MTESAHIHGRVYLGTRAVMGHGTLFNVAAIPKAQLAHRRTRSLRVLCEHTCRGAAPVWL